MFSNFVTMFSNFSWYLMRPRVNPLLRNPLLVRIHCSKVHRHSTNDVCTILLSSHSFFVLVSIPNALKGEYDNVGIYNAW